METGNLFEPRALITGAIIGAVGFWLLHRQLSGLALGAGVGATVVIGTKLVGA